MLVYWGAHTEDYKMDPFTNMIGLAVEIDQNYLVTAIVAMAGGIAGGIKLVLSWVQKTLEAKDATIKDKDAKIEELSKKVSSKSDEHAEKVEQLMNLTLNKVEEFGSRQAEGERKTLETISEFTQVLRGLTIHDGDT